MCYYANMFHCIYIHSFIVLYIMRPRIQRGTLVASTNSYRRILSKRLIVEVLYTFRRGVVSEEIKEFRQTINQ